MPAVDYEVVNVKLRALIASKPSHGRDALLRQMAEIEADCMIPEDQRGYDDRPVVHYQHRTIDPANSAASHA